MFDKCDLLAISVKQRVERYLERLVQEERGASDIVAILVVIVILIAVASTFRQGLIDVISTAFSRAVSFVGQ